MSANSQASGANHLALNISSSSTLTLAAWFKVNGFDKTGYDNFVALENPAGGTGYRYAGFIQDPVGGGANDLIQGFWYDGNGDTFGTDGTVTSIVDQWVFVAIVCDGTSFTFFYGTETGSLTSSGLTADFNASDFSRAILASDGFGENANGSFRGARLWSAALNQTELEAERDSADYSAVRTANLLSALPLANGTNPEVASVGSDWTLTGTFATDASDPDLGADTIAPTGIASDEAFGAHAVAADASVSPSGIASGEAFGAHVVGTGLQVAPTGIASSEAFGAHVVGEQVAPTGIASGEAFGGAAIAHVISVAGIASGEAFGGASIVTGQQVAPTGISSGEAFGTAKVYASAGTFPLKVSSNGRYLEQQDGTPFPVVGEAAWSAIVQWTLSEAQQYLDDRAAKGFNSILVELVEHFFSTNAPNNIANDPPFTGTAFQSAANQDYIDHAISVIEYALGLGMVVQVSSCYTGFSGSDEGWDTEILAATDSQMYGWGAYVGALLAPYDGIVHVIGGDSNPDATMQSRLTSFVNGLKSEDSRHILTAHCAPGTSSVEQWGQPSWLDLNFAYSSHPTTVAETDIAFGESPTIPFILGEAYYENEHSMTPQQLRAQAYWAMLRGGCGHNFGNCPIWHAGASVSWCGTTDWQGNLDSDGSWSMSRLAYLLGSRPWHLLEPDLTDTVMTAGHSTGTDYAVAALASDGSTMVAYLPSSREVTIDLTEFSGSSVQAWWVDGATGAIALAGPFATSGSQALTPPFAGDSILVIDDVAQGFEAPSNGGILPAGIASSEAFGGASVDAGQFVSPSGIASAEAFGNQTLDVSPIILDLSGGTPAHFAQGNYPRDIMHSSVWKTTFTPTQDYDLPYQSMYLIANDDSPGFHGLFFTGSQPAATFRIYDSSGAVVLDQQVTFSADQPITVTFDHPGRTLKIEGATTGDGTFSYTTANDIWLDEALHVGANAADGDAFVGSVSSFELVLSGVSPTGIASAEAFGGATVTAGGAVAPTGIASAEAFGGATVAASSGVAPVGIASAEAFGVAGVTAGGAVAPTGIAGAEAFGEPAVSAGSGLSPTGIASAEAFGAASVLANASIVPIGVASAEAFGAASVTAGAVVSPAGVASAEAFGVPSATQGGDIAPAGIPSLETFGGASIVADAVVAPTGVASGEAFGAPVLSSVVTLAPPAISSAESFGLAAVALLASVGAGIPSGEAFGAAAVGHSVGASGIPSAEAFGVAGASLEVQHAGVAPGEAFGMASVAAGSVVSPAGVASGEVFGVPGIEIAGTVAPSGIASLEAFGDAAVSAGSLIAAAGIASSEAAGEPSVSLAVAAAGVVSGEAFGGLGVAVQVAPGGVPSSEAFGSPAASFGVDAGGIASLEAFGAPTLTVFGAVAPASIQSAEAFGVPIVVSLDGIYPQGVASAEAFGAAALHQTLSVLGVSSGEAFGGAGVSLILEAASVTGGEAFGAPSLDSANNIGPAGVPSGEAFGVLSVVADAEIAASAVTSDEAFGLATVDDFSLPAAKLSPPVYVAASPSMSPIYVSRG